MVESNANINDIMDRIISEAYNIINWKIISAKHSVLEDSDKMQEVGLPVDYFDYNHESLEEIVNMVKPLLKDVSISRKIEAESVKDVLKLLNKGKISIDEALKLMNLMGKKEDIVDVESKNKLNNRLMDLIGE